MSTAWRYLLFQIPGWVISALVLVVLLEIELLSGRLAMLLWGLWLLKDALMYPLVRSSYEASAHQHGAMTLVGARGVVVRALRPRGYIRVRGELWQAECATGADVGAEVEVVAAKSMRLVVTAVAAESTRGGA